LERESLQNKFKEAQIQLQVAKEALSKYRERESELRADEVSMGKQLVRASSHTEMIYIDFLLA
jgi:predicted transcriptional regulator